jgi:hypothetical protein
VTRWFAWRVRTGASLRSSTSASAGSGVCLLQLQAWASVAWDGFVCLHCHWRNWMSLLSQYGIVESPSFIVCWNGAHISGAVTANKEIKHGAGGSGRPWPLCGGRLQLVMIAVATHLGMHMLCSPDEVWWLAANVNDSRYSNGTTRLSLPHPSHSCETRCGHIQRTPHGTDLGQEAAAGIRCVLWRLHHLGRWSGIACRPVAGGKSVTSSGAFPFFGAAI